MISPFSLSVSRRKTDFGPFDIERRTSRKCEATRPASCSPLQRSRNHSRIPAMRTSRTEVSQLPLELDPVAAAAERKQHCHRRMGMPDPHPMPSAICPAHRSTLPKFVMPPKLKFGGSSRV